MKKTYLPRVVLLSLSLFVVIGLYFGPCKQMLGRCMGGNDMPIARSSFHFLVAASLISLFLFLVNDNIFKKWLIFSLVWLVLSFILILVTPEYSGGWGPNFNPDRETVSIWMGVLFVIISLVLIIWQSVKERKRG